jgi:predicted phage terminase large subunit-like protein
MLDRQAAVPRIYPATDTGKPDGTPVLWTREYFDERRKLSSPYIFSCQILQNPKADDAIGFKEPWLRFWVPKNIGSLNKYIIVDPANTKNKRSDYTAIIVIGIGEDDNFYILDMVRDRLDLAEKASAIMELVRQYKPIRMVGYEQYGMQADIEAIKSLMDREMFRFNIKPLGGKLKKEDRIQRLIPLFEQSRIYIPDKLIRVNREGMQQDLTQVFIRDEYLAFPFAAHDDMLDALSRIVDPEMNMRAPGPKSNRRRIKSKGVDYNPWSR